MRNMLTKVLSMLVAGVVAQTLPARAATCSWSAEMQDDEGGSVMTASVCGGPRQDAHLILTCLGQLRLSYDLGPSGPELQPGISGSFEFSAGGKTATRELNLEAMYNYFVLPLTPTDPVLAMLGATGEVTVSSAEYGENSFTLKGSSKAIRKVLASCDQGEG
jgi:hypothetical protein